MPIQFNKGQQITRAEHHSREGIISTSRFSVKNQYMERIALLHDETPKNHILRN